MFSTDQSHFRKYLTTLGVAIMAGTLSLAGLFLRLQQDLLVSNSTLASLPSNARDALLRRQDYLTIATWILPWFIAAGFFGGLGLSAFGMVGWARRQRVSDELEDIDLHKGRAEILHMTDEERADKIDREAEDAVQVPSDLKSTTTESQQPRETRVPDLSFSTIRSEYAVIENDLVQKLRAAYRPEDVTTNLAIRTGSNARLEVDAILRPYGPDSVVFEVKYAASKKNVLNQTVSGLQNAARAADALGARSILVLVVSDSASEEEIGRSEQQAKELAATYISNPSVYVGRSSDFRKMNGKEFLERLGLE